jgi:hypothetical protein
MTDPQSTLPEMTRTEASFHASVAGARAAREAEALGNDPAHVTALGTAAVGGVEIHGVPFALPSAYSALAVPAISELMAKHGITLMQLRSDCLFLLAFQKPREVYRLAVTQADAAAAKTLVALADRIALALETRERIDEAVAWCMDAFRRLNGVKKPSTPAAELATGSPSIEAPSSTASPAPIEAAAPVGS